MRLKNKMKKTTAAIFAIIILIQADLSAQLVESPLLIFNRGIIWHTLSYAKSGPAYNNWAQTGPSLDWPGFDPAWVGDDIGGAPSHMVTGGFWIGAKRDRDTVLAVEDWAMYGSTVADEPTAKYRVAEHRKVYANGANNWLQTNKKTGEDLIRTVWEYNPNYFTASDIETQLPVRVTRNVHMWSGSKHDETYIIYDFVIKNISDELKAKYPNKNNITDTLYSTHILISYGLQSNSRSWKVLFPQETQGARNTKIQYSNPNKLFYGENTNYGFSNSLGRVVNGAPQGEWLAPGYVGWKLLYASPDSTGIPTRVDQTKVGWSQADNSLDLSGPFTGVSGTLDARYNVVKNPSSAYRFVRFPNNVIDTNFVEKSRKWSLMSLGPWTLAPGDSIRLSYAEIVDGMDYKFALDRNIGPNTIFQESYRKGFEPSFKRAQLTYDNGFDHPDPPAAPKFEVNFYEGAQKIVANTVRWGTETEGIADPDDGTLDLAGYRLYRSDFLPIGPWELIGDIKKADPSYYDAASGKYVFIDSTVQIGTGYYYSVTAYDTGKASWPVNPAAIFPETNSNRVPPRESSIFANRMTFPFLATLPAPKSVDQVLVVPNPFVIGEGSSQPGESDQIQFINVPNPSTVRIYTLRGDLVKTIEVSSNTGGIVTWNQVTDFGQFVESGVYIYQVDSQYGKHTGKFAIVR